MGGDERRQSERAMVPLDGEWHGSSGHRSGRIADISVGGCFVESMAAPSVGEQVGVKVMLPNGELLEALGEVAYVAMGMGFGIRFLDLTPHQEALLLDTMRRLLK